MRHVKESSKWCDDDSSGPSSVQSIDTDYEIFFSGCSDYSDYEREERRRKSKKIRFEGSSLEASKAADRSQGTMQETESSPLLAATTTYKTIRSNRSSDQDPEDLSVNAILNSYKIFDQSTSQEKRTQSSLVTIFSVWNTIMGSSLLTMAWGVERAGLPVALVLVAFMAALCLYTAYVLLRVNVHHGSESCEVPALCRALLGRWAQRSAHAFSLLVLLGANVVYWLLMTNFLYFTVNYLVDLSSPNATEHNSTLLCPKLDGLNGSLLVPADTHAAAYWGLHSTVPVYVALIIFPLLSFRNVSFFTKFNSLGTLSVAYLLLFVCVKAWAWGVGGATGPGETGAVVEDTGGAGNAAALSGMLALSFYIHNIIITVMSNNENQQNNGRDLTIAFVLVTITYIVVGVGFYICFPLAKACIEDNILNNFEMHDVMTAVARMLLLFQVVTVFPLVAFMLRTEAILLLPLKDTRTSMFAINAIIVTMCILVACFCPSIGTIIRYTGAVSGLVHVFALPSFLQIRSLQLRGKLTWWKTAFYSLIVLFGTVNLIMQFFIHV